MKKCTPSQLFRLKQIAMSRLTWLHANLLQLSSSKCVRSFPSRQALQVWMSDGLHGRDALVSSPKQIVNFSKQWNHPWCTEQIMMSLRMYLSKVAGCVRGRLRAICSTWLPFGFSTFSSFSTFTTRNDWIIECRGEQRHQASRQAAKAPRDKDSATFHGTLSHYQIQKTTPHIWCWPSWQSTEKASTYQRFAIMKDLHADSCPLQNIFLHKDRSIGVLSFNSA